MVATLQYAVIFRKFPGVDLPTRTEFVACDRTEAEIQKALGADGLLYQTLDDLIGAAQDINPKITKFEDSVFSGIFLV